MKIKTADASTEKSFQTWTGFEKIEVVVKYNRWHHSDEKNMTGIEKDSRFVHIYLEKVRFMIKWYYKKQK